MFDMINNGGHGNGIGTEEGTQAKAYYFDGQPFFDVPSADSRPSTPMAKGQMKVRTRRRMAPIQTAMFRKTPRLLPRPRRRYQRGSQAIDPRRTFTFAGLNGQLAKTPFSALIRLQRIYNF
jgi:hypothetical protein